ncbi:MAG: sugar ABC transporter permease [Firmicutes bacterium]|nr:sugar ABC transporter permease [Bacillota bacterium]
MMRKSHKEALEGYLFALPWFIGFAVFYAYPTIASLVFSFFDYDVYSRMDWVGLNNYVHLFTDDDLFWKSLYNTLYYTAFSVPLGMIVGLCIALLLNQDIKGLTFFRTIYYLPSVLSGVAVSILWIWIFDPGLGLLNIALEKIGIWGPNWLSDPAWSKPALIIMSLWGAGSSMIIYLSGLQSVPTELYEAARVDGANAFQNFIYITLPMISPVLLFTLITGIIGSFQVFTQAFVMTEGGPLNSTLFYVLYLYRKAFGFLQMGMASAMAWILAIIVAVIAYFILRTSDVWVHYQGGLG